MVDIMKYFGKLNNIDWEKRKKEMDSFRKSFFKKTK